MPELEYLVLAEYVRQDAGMTHIMGAGFDTITVPAAQLPAGVPVGAVARVTFSSRDPVGDDHDIELALERSDGESVLSIRQRFPAPARAPGVPETWRMAATIMWRFALLIPEHGNYRLQAVLDDDPRQSRSVDVRAIAPDAGQQ